MSKFYEVFDLPKITLNVVTENTTQNFITYINRIKKNKDIFNPQLHPYFQHASRTKRITMKRQNLRRETGNG